MIESVSARSAFYRAAVALPYLVLVAGLGFGLALTDGLDGWQQRFLCLVFAAVHAAIAYSEVRIVRQRLGS